MSVSTVSWSTDTPPHMLTLWICWSVEIFEASALQADVNYFLTYTTGAKAVLSVRTCRQTLVCRIEWSSWAAIACQATWARSILASEARAITLNHNISVNNVIFPSGLSCLWKLSCNIKINSGLQDSCYSESSVREVFESWLYRISEGRWRSELDINRSG